jgi:hypothetical protein
MSGLHTYMVQRFRMRPGRPLTFSDGERIVAVLRSEVVPGGVSTSDDMDLIVLVEMPGSPSPARGAG